MHPSDAEPLGPCACFSELVTGDPSLCGVTHGSTLGWPTENLPLACPLVAHWVASRSAATSNTVSTTAPVACTAPQRHETARPGHVDAAHVPQLGTTGHPNSGRLCAPAGLSSGLCGDALVMPVGNRDPSAGDRKCSQQARKVSTEHWTEKKEPVCLVCRCGGLPGPSEDGDLATVD